jgi:hypothetical protein
MAARHPAIEVGGREHLGLGAVSSSMVMRVDSQHVETAMVALGKIVSVISFFLRNSLTLIPQAAAALTP